MKTKTEGGDEAEVVALRRPTVQEGRRLQKMIDKMGTAK